MKKLILYVLLLILYAHSSSAQQIDSLKKSSLKIWGYADIYYAYDFNEPANHIRNEMVNGNTAVYSHNRHNEFALNHGIIGLTYEQRRVRGALAYQTGTYVRANYAAEPTILQGIYEAYAGYMIHRKVWIDAGIFTSHIGSESAIASDNLTLSRSMMADNTPYYETGAKLTYAPSDKLILTGLILNGWQNIQDYNSNKALGTQIQYKPSEHILLNSSTFFGKEVTAFEPTSGLINTDSLSTQRFFHNFYAQFLFGKKIILMTAFDVGLQKKRITDGSYVWYNPNMILKYTISNTFAAVARAEYYHDKNGVIIYSGTKNGFQTFAPSLGLDVKLSEQVLWRIEGRMFYSKDPIYVKHSNAVYNDGFVLTSLAIKLKS